MAMRKKIFLMALIVSMFLLSAGSVVAIGPQFEGETTNVTSPAIYKFLSEIQFNVTITNTSGVDTLLLEHNLTSGAATMVNTSNVSTYTGSEWYTTLRDVPVGNYTYRWIGNDTDDNQNASEWYGFEVYKANTSVVLYFDNLISSNGAMSWRRNATSVNTTATLNVSDYVTEKLNVNISTNSTEWGNFIWRTNSTTTKEMDSTDINVTGFFDENANYTGSSQTTYLRLTDGVIKSYDINDTYTNFNDSIMFEATVNSSFAVTVTFELNTSGKTANITMAAGGVGVTLGDNYTYNLTKSNFGDLQANITTIYINRVFAVDSASTINEASNSTGLSFDLASSTMGITIDPDPVANTESSVSVKVNYTAGDNTFITVNCTTKLFDITRVTSYSSGWLVAGYNPTGKTIGTYTYVVNCSNSSYQSHDGQAVLQVIGGRSGGDGGTGGPTPTTTTTVPGLPGIIRCGNGICEVGETWVNCWGDCPLITWPSGPVPGDITPTTVVPVGGGPVEISPEQYETIVVIGAFIAIGLIVTKLLRFW